MSVLWAASGEKEVTDQERRNAEGDMAAGCLEMIREALRQIGCKCGPDAHKSTPPMMYPEWIACVVSSAVDAERERCAKIAERYNVTDSDGRIAHHIRMVDSPA